ncbi:Protein of unknown function DUF1674 [Trinorchestia longiramus]|nr:Protein of unknown function DUF1674 [Trinorchestia longiramus]
MTTLCKIIGLQRKFHGSLVRRLSVSVSVSHEADGADLPGKATMRKPSTPGGKLDSDETTSPPTVHPYQEKEPLPPHPDNTNPDTGEIGGPRGPEPTRYGDWERKGRVSDF